MPSFDIVSKVDMQELDNAVNQALKEIVQRYDFKGTHNEINLENEAIVLLGAGRLQVGGSYRCSQGKTCQTQPFPEVSRFRQKGTRFRWGGAPARGYRAGHFQGKRQRNHQSHQRQQTQGAGADHG